MGMSNYYKQKLLDATYNATAYSVAVPYISLHTADPGTTGANEVTAGAYSYARKDASAAFPAAASGSISSNGDITWTNLPAVTITHIGVNDAASGANFLKGGALANSRTVEAGGSFTISSGNLSDTFS